jgi:large subunit ribosomal protein L19
MNANILNFIHEQLGNKTKLPSFKAGDTVTVHYKIKEGDKERIQQFQGVVIQRKGVGATESFTVRKISNGVGVERIFPVTSPFIEKIEVNKVGIVRRARIFYMRALTGKSARIAEKKKYTTTADAAEEVTPA